MNNQQIEELAKENHIVNNLVALKQIWGLKMRVGIVMEDNTTRRCATIQELMDAGCVSDPKFLVIDEHWDKLKMDQPQNIILTLSSQ